MRRSGSSRGLALVLWLCACQTESPPPDAPRDGGAEDAVSDGCVVQAYYRDQDGDGHGARSASLTACTAPDGYVSSNDDCDDACAACAPGSTEVCEGSVDESCDGSVDEGCACTAPASRPCGTDTGECSLGMQRCEAGAWTACDATGPMAESCNDLDEDCDAIVDEGASASCAVLPHAVAACVSGACAVGTCEVGFGDCDGVAEDGCELAFAPGECVCGGCAPGYACGSGHTCQLVGATTVAIPIGGEPVALAEDASGNLYVVGHYATGGEHFGDATPPDPGSDHAYVVSFDAEGGYRWFSDLGACPSGGCTARTMDARATSSGASIAVVFGRGRMFPVHADGTFPFSGGTGETALPGRRYPLVAPGPIDSIALLFVAPPSDTFYAAQTTLGPATEVSLYSGGSIDLSTTWPHYGSVDGRARGFIGGVSEGARATAFGVAETNAVHSCVGAPQRHTRLRLRIADDNLIELDGTEAGFADELLDATPDDIGGGAFGRSHFSARLSLGATARVTARAGVLPFGATQPIGSGLRRFALVGATYPTPFTVVDEGPGTLERDARGRSWVGYSLRGTDTFQGVPAVAHGAGDVLAARLSNTGLPEVLIQTGGPGDERAIDYVAQENGAAILASFSGTARFGEHDVTSYGPDDGVLWIVRPTCAGGGVEDCTAAGDEDCDGEVDEGCGCTADTTCGTGVGTCSVTPRACVGGVLAACAAPRPAPEECDGADEDCDGVVDEAALCPGAAHAAGVCVSGACTTTCLPGFADCNGLAADGCEVDLASPATCGGCAVTCGATQRCRSSACEERPRPHVWAASTSLETTPQFPVYEAEVIRGTSESAVVSSTSVRVWPDQCTEWFAGGGGAASGSWAIMPRGGMATFYAETFQTRIYVDIADSTGHVIEATTGGPAPDAVRTVAVAGGTVACARLSARSDIFACITPTGTLTSRYNPASTPTERGLPFVDGAGRYCEVGTFRGTTTALGAPVTSAGGSDIFIACLDTSSNSPVTVTTFGGAGDETVVAAQADGYGAGIVVGTFVGATTLGGTSLVSHGGADVFVLGVDAALAPTFVLSGGSAEDDTIAIESVRPDRTFHLRGTMGAGDHEVTATFGSSTFTGREYHWVVDTTP